MTGDKGHDSLAAGNACDQKRQLLTVSKAVRQKWNCPVQSRRHLSDFSLTAFQLTVKAGLEEAFQRRAVAAPGLLCLQPPLLYFPQDALCGSKAVRAFQAELPLGLQCVPAGSQKILQGPILPEEGLHGAHIYFDVVSVGATMNIMLAAVLAKGQTVLENCAKEPHIVDLANFLNALGADVKGAGTDVIKIRGVESLHGGSYSIIPDQIEAGTFMAAVAACGGAVLVKNVIPKHLECITAKLKEMSVEVTEFDDAVLVRREGTLTKTNIKTMPYPGFPTDMQPQIAVCMALAEGTSLVTEGIYDNRFRYTAELNRMGASIQVESKTAVIDGVTQLHGCEVRACDLRAGAAMVIAALCAEGSSR